VWRRERLTNRHPGRHVSKQEPLAWGAPASGDVRREFLRGLPSLLRPRAPSTGWASVVIRPQARASALRSARRVAPRLRVSPTGDGGDAHTATLSTRMQGRTGVTSGPRSPRRRPFTESQAHILRILRASDVADTTRYASGCPTRPVDLRPQPDVFPAQNLPRGTSEPRPDRQRASGPSGQWPLPANQPCRG
jgi:hypothetical protein